MVRCPDCRHTLSPIITDDGKCRYTCSCGFNSEALPVVKGVIVKRKNSKSGVAVLVSCPFCGKEHYHSTQPLPGLRKSHCSINFGGWDAKSDIMLGKYLEKYPLAYKGGTYYVYVWEVAGKGSTEQEPEHDTRHAGGEISGE